MAAKKPKVGDLIKEARTEKGYTQQQLADKIDGLSASDISKAERGEKELTQAQLKAIAKATGVTQKSLLEAAAGASTTTAASSSSSSKETSMKVSASEKKLVELYRKADSDTKKSVMKLLKGENDDASELINTVLGTAMDLLLKK